jgi:hypothetical protein
MRTDFNQVVALALFIVPVWIAALRYDAPYPFAIIFSAVYTVGLLAVVWLAGGFYARTPEEESDGS